MWTTREFSFVCVVVLRLSVSDARTGRALGDEVGRRIYEPDIFHFIFYKNVSRLRPNCKKPRDCSKSPLGN